MDSSDSLHLDEHLARLLAAYDQGMDDADGHAATIGVPGFQSPSLNPDERRVEPLSGSGVNRGSQSELLPDSSRLDPFTLPSPSEVHRVGRFELRRQLGRGGCGIVFLAHDPKLKRDVALKIPRPELLMSPDARKRLVREATAAAGFDHPNLVPVYETGEIGPICFIATVFCPGLTLAEWLDRQTFPVPIRQAARLVAQLAEAVQHAHDRGVLHRDLKPNNVILQDVKTDPNLQEAPPGACPLRGEHYIPRVVDFGLAKLADQGPGETATRQVLGTPKYMAPEQAQARHEDVGPEADVYALGGILYEMLTGRAPYEGATDIEVLRQCIEGNLTPPRSLRKDLPRDLEAICIRAMAKSPARRYRTAIDFADDLRRFLDGLPTLARPLNGFGRSARWLRRNDQLFALITLSTICLVLLISGMWNAYQSDQFQVVRNENEVREAERIRLENARTYSRHVHEAFLFWQAGSHDPMLASLRDARLATGMNSTNPEFAWGYLTQQSRQANAPLDVPAANARAIAVSPQGNWIATGHADGMLRVWRREPLRAAGAIRAQASDVSRVLFLDGSRILTCGAGSPHVWDVNAAGELKPLPFDDRFTALATLRGTVLAPWGAVESADAANAAGHWRFAVVKDGGEVALEDVARREMRRLPRAGGTIRTLAATADGQRLAAVCDDDSLCLWNLTDESHRSVRGLGHTLHGAAFAPDGTSLYVAAEDGIYHLNATADPAGPTLRDRAAPVSAIAVRPESAEHAIAYADGSLEIFSSRAIAPRSVPGEGRRSLAALRYPSDGPLVGVEWGVDHVSVWEFGPTAKRAMRQPVRAAAVDLSPRGESLAVADEHGRVQVWPVAAGGATGTVALPSGVPVHRIAFSENGRWLAVPLEAGAVGLWLVGETSIPLKVVGHAEGTTQFRFLSDDRLATAGRDGSIKVWNLLTLREEFTLLGHVGRITSLAASPDLRTLVSGGADGTVRFWDLRTGRELLALSRHRGPVLAAEFATNGKFLLTGSSFRGRGELAFWDAVYE